MDRLLQNWNIEYHLFDFVIHKSTIITSCALQNMPINILKILPPKNEKF